MVAPSLLDLCIAGSSSLWGEIIFVIVFLFSSICICTFMFLFQSNKSTASQWVKIVDEDASLFLFSCIFTKEFHGRRLRKLREWKVVYYTGLELTRVPQTSPLAPEDIEVLNTNWHLQSSFYVTTGTLSFKFLTQTLLLLGIRKGLDKNGVECWFLRSIYIFTPLWYSLFKRIG